MAVLGGGAVSYEQGAPVGTSNCGIESLLFLCSEKTSGCSPCHEAGRSVCECASEMPRLPGPRLTDATEPSSCRRVGCFLQAYEIAGSSCLVCLVWETADPAARLRATAGHEIKSRGGQAAALNLVAGQALLAGLSFRCS